MRQLLTMERNLFLLFPVCDRMAELAESGVRHVYSENGNPPSNDFEPEYIAINEDETKAFVSLQVQHINP